MKNKIILLFIFAILLCSCSKKYDELIVGNSTNVLTDNDKTIVREIFEDNNISNVDLFFEWLNDFNKEEDMGCGIKSWHESKTFSYSNISCANRYEKNHDISDGNCRITAYSLLQSIIEINTKEEAYESYLMFDIDVLENNKNYEAIKNDQQKFINIFNEMDVSAVLNEEYKNVYPNKLKELGFKINNDKVKLISVVLNDNEFDLLFVGHAGVLIELSDKYLFIEKIAFEQPYQISVIKDTNDLIEMFRLRDSYFLNDGEEGPFVYENDKLIYEFE